MVVKVMKIALIIIQISVKIKTRRVNFMDEERKNFPK